MNDLAIIAEPIGEPIAEEPEPLQGEVLSAVFTDVHNLATNQIIRYQLPPSQAVINAYEQFTVRNQNWWTYKLPEDHPAFLRGKRSVCCGDWAALIH